MLIGEKIKEIRISKKLTQQEVVGSFITRNMLSKIENNSATPSVKTLEFLANKLGVPPSALLDEVTIIEDNKSYNNNVDLSHITALIKARSALRNRDMDECIMAIKYFSGKDLSNLLNEDCDEACIILAFAFLEKAITANKNHDYRNAINFAQEAIKNNKKSLYYNQTIDAKATLLLNDSILKI